MLIDFWAALLPVLPVLIAGAIAAGLIAGLFGLGGGIVIVPLVFFLLQRQGVSLGLAMAMAVVTSMAAIIPTGIMSAFAHHKYRQVAWPILRLWSLPLAIGVVLGSTLIVYLRSPWLVAFFAFFLLAVAIFTLFKLMRGAVMAGLKLSRSVQTGIALVIGFISALAGVGGGTMSVPTLQLMGFEAHRAVGTSSALGVVIALVATLWVALMPQGLPTLPAGAVGLVYWPALLVLLPLSMTMAPVGAWVAKKLPARNLAQCFCLLLLVVATRMLWAIFMA